MENKVEYETKALVPQPTSRAITPSVWQMITTVATAIYKSRLFKMSSPEQAQAIMLKGYELGLPLTASFEFVKVIQGEPTLIPRGALALILGSPLCTGVEIVDEPDACTVTMKRVNGFQHTVRFSVEDAKRAQLTVGSATSTGQRGDLGSWEKYPQNMCRWRAVGFCADVVFPDVIGGLKRADEFGANITPDGDVIEGTWDAVPVTPTTAPEPASVPTITLQELLEHYTAEQIVAANQDRIPATVEECQAIMAALEASNASTNA